MRSVDMDVDALHVFGVHVAAHVGTSVDDKTGSAGLDRPMREYRAEKSRSDNEIIVVHFVSFLTYFLHAAPRNKTSRQTLLRRRARRTQPHVFSYIIIT